MVNQWWIYSSTVSNYRTSGAKDSMVGLTSTEFKKNSKNFSVEDLTTIFMIGFERPSYNPNINHIQTRKTYANNWYSYMRGISPTPPSPPTPTPIPPLPLIDTSGRGRGRKAIIYKKKGK